MLRALGDKLHALQWVCIVLQCGCLVVAQYDPCRGIGAIPTRAYAMIAFSTVLTATCGVWNQKVIKGFPTPVNLQNMVMYAHCLPPRGQRARVRRASRVRVRPCPCSPSLTLHAPWQVRVRVRARRRRLCERPRDG